MNRKFFFQTLLLFLLIITSTSLISCSGGKKGISPLLFLGPETAPESLAVPTGLAATNNNTDKVIITWTAVPRAKFYTVFKSDDESGTYSPLGENNIASFSDDTAEPGKKFYYKVQAGWRSASDPSQEVVSSISNPCNGYAILSAPAGVNATEDSLLAVVVSWTSVNNADVYTVLRSESESGQYTEIANSVDNTTYSDPSGVQGKIYYYKVVAYSATNIPGLESSFDSGYRCTEAPASFQASDGNFYTCIKLQWTAAAGASHYEIFRSVNSSGYSTTPIGTSATTNYIDSNASFGNTYEYKVRAVLSIGGKSSFSNADSGSLRDPDASFPCAVSWAANREKAVNTTGGGYRIYYSKTAGFAISTASYAIINYVSGPAAPTSASVNIGPGPGTWYIKVVAFSSLNSGSFSQPSAETSITLE